MAAIVQKLRQVSGKPPRYIAWRVAREARARAERYLAPIRNSALTATALARAAGHRGIDEWWQALARRPFVARPDLTAPELTALCAGDVEEILAAAGRALADEVDLLGSGPVSLGERIDWHRDYKTGHRWPPQYCHAIEYNNLELPSDVKFPWELSRMQWLIPAAQAFVLTREDRYAEKIKTVIADWIEENPYGGSVNWACTMDVALRAIAWTWFFHACHDSPAWSDSEFRARFLRSLYLHGEFTTRHLEESDVNGNHFASDAAGLVFLGLFFGAGAGPQLWLRQGWQILESEVTKQVFADGVDFEASIAYHRLVQELFLLPALYRLRHSLPVAPAYAERLTAMARFTAAYSRPDGSVPLVGDADDGRTLPFRQRPINDHRYLIGLTGLAFSEPGLVEGFSGPRSEIAWLLGAAAASRLPDRSALDADQPSAAFPDGGFYILRNRRDHVFVDCGPVGMAGRGGHGHNDLLSFEAVLDGVHLVTDCGAYLYTADYRARNAFRSTASHNTPLIDDEEINRFVRPDNLWTLRKDATERVHSCHLAGPVSSLAIGHSGYERLPEPVRVVRTIELDHAAHRLTITDRFEGAGEHAVAVPLHFAPGVSVELTGENEARLRAGKREFALTWSSPQSWSHTIEPARVSPTYGVAEPALAAVSRRRGPLAELTATLQGR